MVARGAFLMALYKEGIAPPIPEHVIRAVEGVARNLSGQRKAILFSAVRDPTSLAVIAANTHRVHQDREKSLAVGTLHIAQRLYINPKFKELSADFPDWNIDFWLAAAILSRCSSDWIAAPRSPRRRHLGTAKDVALGRIQVKPGSRLERILHLLAQGWVYKEIVYKINKENPEMEQTSERQIKDSAIAFRYRRLRIEGGALSDFLRAIYRRGPAPPIPDVLLADVKRWAGNLASQRKSILMAAAKGTTSSEEIAAMMRKKKGGEETRLTKGTVKVYIRDIERSLKKITYPEYSLHLWQVAAMLSLSDMDWATNEPAAPAKQGPPGGKWLWLRNILSSWGWISEEAYDRRAWWIENTISLSAGVLLTVPVYIATGSFEAAIPRFLAGTVIVFLAGHLADAVLNIGSRRYSWSKILAHLEIATGILAVSSLPLLSSQTIVGWRLGFAIGLFFVVHLMGNVLVENSKKNRTPLLNITQSLEFRVVIEFLRRYSVFGLFLSLEAIYIAILLTHVLVLLDHVLARSPDIPMSQYMIDEYVTGGILMLFGALQLALLSLGLRFTRSLNRYLDLSQAMMIPAALAYVYFAMRFVDASSIGGGLGLFSITSTLIFSLIQVIKRRMELTPRFRQSSRQRASAVNAFLRTSAILGGLLVVGNLALGWFSSGPASSGATSNPPLLDPVLRPFGGWMQLMLAIGVLWLGRWATPWLARLPKSGQIAGRLLRTGSALVVGGLVGNALATWANSLIRPQSHHFIKDYLASALLLGPNATAGSGDLMFCLGIDLLAMAAILVWIDWKSGGDDKDGPNTFGPSWRTTIFEFEYGNQRTPEKAGAMRSQELQLAA
jgi:hypothetical protein